MMDMIAPVQNLIIQSIQSEDGGTAAAAGTVERPAAYVTADALGHFVAVETPWYKSAINWVSDVWRAKSDGAPGCGIGAELMFDKARRSDGGVGPDASDGGPDAADSGPDAADADAGVCVDNNPPGVFGTTQPEDNASDVSLRPTFEWANSTDPDGHTVTYDLMIDTNADFTSAVTYDASTLRQYTLTDPLAADTTYYWRVVARDVCDAETVSLPSPAFSFKTLADCSTNPGTFDLVDPADQADWVSLTPTLDWTDSLDLDPGDTVTYRLEIADNAQFNNSTVYSGLTESAYTLNAGEALANGQTYHWRVFAEDDCQNEVASTTTYEFTTEPACIPQTILETDFVTGDGTDVVVNAGSVSLGEDYSAWTAHYEGDVDPTTVGWSEQASSGWVINQINSGSLHLSTIGLNDSGRYERNAVPFGNTNGWIIETKMRVVTSEPEVGSDYGCGMVIGDNNRVLRPRFYTDRVDTNDYTGQFLLDGTQTHTYRFIGQGDDFFVYVDGNLAIDGTGQMVINALNNRLYFGDIGSDPDCDAYWNYIYYYTLGTSLPYAPTGEYISSTYDLGANPNNIGSGATLVFNGSVLPSTTITIDTRSGDTAIPDGTWSSWQGLSGNQIQSPEARYLQIRSNLSASDDTITPQLDDYTVDYCAY
ncbi:MAG: Ig-like domain-containing protein [Candidatus Margulisiibacteriota bacterium]|nr:Ig-like domain-containing protein [Candidatus Margulisiibacteriota bacterium]